MRDLADVIAKMKGVMPQAHHADLDRFAYAIKYRAPEQQRESWMEVQIWLLSTLRVRKPVVIEKGDEWKAEVLALWADKTTEQMTAEGLLEWRN